jgi:NADH:ubiquinone reductase (H+-translocating)
MSSPELAAQDSIGWRVEQAASAGRVMVRDAAARPHVVVVGAGFAGLQAAKALMGRDVNVTVVDRHNHHLFQPLLYQVATAALEPADISSPIRLVLRAENVNVLMADVTGVDVRGRRIELGPRVLDYDYLLLATGAAHSYFGHSEWAARAPGLKTLEDALEIRRRVLYAFEAAEQEPDPVLQQAWLTFVVVGGGPTGVELAGALAEIARHARPNEFRHIDPRRARILLLEGLPHVLSDYPEALSDKARRSLERLGVEVRTGQRVTDIRAEEVRTEGFSVTAKTVLWAAGVAASPLARSLGVELDRVGRVKVTPRLTLPGHDEIYVLGDLAAVEQDGKMLPGLAPVAMAEGKHAAHNILRAARGEPLLPFRYWDRGSFAVIGRGHAVGVAFQRVRMWGFLAWLAWLAIHITFLIGFRNRVAVLFNWAYVYLTTRRHAQLIVGAGDLTQQDIATSDAAETNGGGEPAPEEPKRAPPSNPKSKPIAAQPPPSA